MRTQVPEKLLQVLHDIDVEGHGSLMRLTVLKKWFERPGRLSAFALWVSARAASRKGKTKGQAGELFDQTRKLLANLPPVVPQVERKEAEALHNRLHEFQNQYQRQRWGKVRVIQNWNLLLVEKGLAIYLWHANSPARGYDLAADFCRHYDPQYGSDLNGPSYTKLREIIRFMFHVEALEDGDNED